MSPVCDYVTQRVLFLPEVSANSWEETASVMWSVLYESQGWDLVILFSLSFESFSLRTLFSPLPRWLLCRLSWTARETEWLGDRASSGLEQKWR